MVRQHVAISVQTLQHERKIRVGKSEPFYERLALQALGIDKLKATHVE